MTDLRQTILAEQDLIASRRRFALFSQPPPLAVGDDGQYQKKTHAKGENGKPITQPPQLLPGPARTGMIKSSYFGVPESIYSHDPFKEQHKLDCQYQLKMHSKANFHETDFKPASGTKTLMKASYEYIEQKTAPRKGINRDENGKIQTQLRNFTTNPTSKVEDQFFKPNKHMPDPYDRKRQLEKKEREDFKKKLPEALFKSMSHGDRPFDKISKVYGEDPKAQLLSQSRKPRSNTTMKTVAHEAAFRPARRGHGDPIGKYPKFIQKQTTETIEPRRTQKTEGRQSWKPNNWGLSRPTPSISLHPKNIIGRYK